MEILKIPLKVLLIILKCSIDFFYFLLFICIFFLFVWISLLSLLAGTPIRPRPEEAEKEEEEAKRTTGGTSRKRCVSLA